MLFKEMIGKMNFPYKYVAGRHVWMPDYRTLGFSGEPSRVWMSSGEAVMVLDGSILHPTPSYLHPLTEEAPAPYVPSLGILLEFNKEHYTQHAVHNLTTPHWFRTSSMFTAILEYGGRGSLLYMCRAFREAFENEDYLKRLDDDGSYLGVHGISAREARTALITKKLKTLNM